MSRKFAKALSEKTGVSIKWLLAESADGTEIPSVDGRPLQHDDVIGRVDGEIERNLRQAEHYVRDESSASTNSLGLHDNPTPSIHRRMAAVTGKLVEEELFKRLSSGDMRLMDKINRLLMEDCAAEKPDGDVHADDA